MSEDPKSNKDSEFEVRADGIKFKGDLAQDVRPLVKRAVATADSLLRLIDNVVGLPVDYLNRNLEHFRKRFADEFEQIPLENRQEPSMRIGYSVVRGAAMSADEPAIQDLFAKLLASAADAETASLVHPGFATVISEMQASDASALVDISHAFPLARVGRSQLWSEFVPPGVPNLLRLGLVEWVDVPPGKLDIGRISSRRPSSAFGIKPEKALAALSAIEADVASLRSELVKTLTRSTPRQLRITEFGRNFLRVVTRREHDGTDPIGEEPDQPTERPA
ncbi:Abi-alpha family protein [Variovorax sp. RT4R15]|uniref:Abi-alpha family protein n=1 Tax=Variovorax sp. RT4R15 TaxID=3443737 RepID=UPI003F457AF4